MVAALLSSHLSLSLPLSPSLCTVVAAFLVFLQIRLSSRPLCYNTPNFSYETTLLSLDMLLLPTLLSWEERTTQNGIGKKQYLDIHPRFLSFPAGPSQFHPSQLCQSELPFCSFCYSHHNNLSHTATIKADSVSCLCSWFYLGLCLCLCLRLCCISVNILLIFFDFCQHCRVGFLV